MKIKITLLSCFVVAWIGSARAAETLTYEDLVGRLYDMKRLATPPIKGVTSGSFASWDRGARYDEATGKYVHWWANADGTGFMDRNGTMMKLEGPGVIWRIWSAKADKGTLEFYIDNDDIPAWVTPFGAMFRTKPFTDLPELVHIKAKGNNFFVPIPFQKSIRIRGNKGWGMYYQITYTKFPEGTAVPSFTGKLSDADKAALKKANDVWGKRGPRLFASSTARQVAKAVRVGPGETKIIVNYRKPAAITSITVDRLKMDRDDSVKILRDLAIAIAWDGEKKPSVWAPLGDFFGTGAGENLYRSLATGMTQKHYYANWYMPFKSAKIAIRNDGKKARILNVTIHTEPVEGDVSKLLRYHCKWHRDDFSGFDKKQLETDRWPDWPVLKVDGAAGRFCGFHAHMWNPNHLWNKECKRKFSKPFPTFPGFEEGSPKHGFYVRDVARHYWWGEGDEKFFVDGEKMPSTFGTGTEDYFGYAWGTAQAFDSALQAQPRNGAADQIGKLADRAGPGNLGHIAMTRWQVADNVPFHKSFEAVVEKYHPNHWPLLNAYCASWYQAAGTSDYYGVVPASERSGYFIPAGRPKPKPVVEGRYEAETESGHMAVVGNSQGPVWSQQMSQWGNHWSDGKQLIWSCGKPRLALRLAFTTTKAAKGVKLGFTKAADYGRFQLFLDEKELGDVVDLYSPSVGRVDDIEVKVKVPAGKHTLKIKNVGKNDASKGFFFGMDHLQIVE